MQNATLFFKMQFSAQSQNVTSKTTQKHDETKLYTMSAEKTFAFGSCRHVMSTEHSRSAIHAMWHFMCNGRGGEGQSEEQSHWPLC